MAQRFAERASAFAAGLNPFRGSGALGGLPNLADGVDFSQLSADRPSEAAALGYHALRTGLFVAESLPLFWIQQPGAAKHRGERNGPTQEALEHTLERLRGLLSRDAALVGEGLLPLRALAPREPLAHGRNLLRILTDAAAVSSRRKQRKSRDFGKQAETWLEDLPNYYKRNFHYQTDGYLSTESAELYEHQVEILFRGGADAMRRLILRPMKEAFGDSDGQGLRFLELGAGTGIGTRFVSMAFPKAKITCLDLSYPYLKHAQKQLRDRGRLDFVQGDAAALDFQSDRFDAVFSVFLFHELPLPVREEVLEEARRVLTPGGFFGLVDSLQKGDDPELDWALDVFPREFHEPYYAHYAANPMEGLLEAAGFGNIQSDTGYLAKVAWGRAPEATPTKSRAKPRAKKAKSGQSDKDASKATKKREKKSASAKEKPKAKSSPKRKAKAPKRTAQSA